LSFLLVFLAAFFVLLSGIGILNKLYFDAREKLNLRDKNGLKLTLDELIAGTDREFREGLMQFSREALNKGKNYLAMVDDYLLENLERPGAVNRTRLFAVAAHLDFPSECLAQIRSRNSGLSALGSRRAGLYNIAEAVEGMEAALDFFSSGNQFEILMALARMGGADAMQKAFEKIKTSVLINERGVIEILSSFPEGEEKMELFRRMIHNDTNYIAALFLKAVNGKIAKALLDDIVQVFQKGNKEIRAAAVRGLAVLNKEAPAKILLQALEDKDWEVRALAAKALGPIILPEADIALYKALSDQQWWVRQNAANAMIGHPGYESLFILAAESGDEYARDSILSVLENGSSPILLRSIKIMVA